MERPLAHLRQSGAGFVAHGQVRQVIGAADHFAGVECSCAAARSLVACYPARWRDRYGDEYAQLLCDLRVSRRPVLVLDSLRGAVRAHGGVLMSHRSPMAVAVWATGLFTVAGIGFQKLAEDTTGTARGLYAVLVAAAALALLALATAAVPTAVALLRARDGRAWRYLAVPVVGVVVWYGVLRLALRLAAGRGVHSALNVACFVAVAAVGVAVVAATAWAAVMVLDRLPVAEQPARLRPAALLATAVGMAVTTVAALVWGLRVRADDPTGFDGHHGILATPFVSSWVAALTLMAAATVLATVAGRRQLAATR